MSTWSPHPIPSSSGSFAGPKGLVPLPYSEMGPTIEAINEERIMTLKNAIAAVLKAIRKARGLSQNNLAEVSSRTYVSKLERGQYGEAPANDRRRWPSSDAP